MGGDPLFEQLEVPQGHHLGQQIHGPLRSGSRFRRPCHRHLLCPRGPTGSPWSTGLHATARSRPSGSERPEPRAFVPSCLRPERSRPVAVVPSTCSRQMLRAFASRRRFVESLHRARGRAPCGSCPEQRPLRAGTPSRRSVGRFARSRRAAAPTATPIATASGSGCSKQQLGAAAVPHLRWSM